MRLDHFGRKPAAVIIAVLAIMNARAALPAQQPAESPVELVRLSVQNEVASSNGDAKVLCIDRKETPHGSQSKLIVETRDGMAGVLFAVNDKPLTPEQHKAEDARLAGLMKNPEQLKKKQKAEKEDEERITRIVKALPDAFLFEPDGTEVGNQEIGRAGEGLVRLKFRPNPKYSPPSHVEQVLTGMQGYILIDADQRRIAKIDGTLSKDVGFGWGFLGHLDKGGHFLVKQAEVVKGHWDITQMSLSFNGRILLFKGLNIKSDEVFSNFRSAPSDLSFAQGVALLEKQQAELADNRQQSGADNPK